MATSFGIISKLANYSLLKSGLSTTNLLFTRTAVRATRTAKQLKRSKGKGTPGKHRGWKKLSGDYVEKGMILFRQFGLKVYPGENVGCGRDFTLFAMEAGKVELTVEELSPYPESPLYAAVQSGRVVHKLFYNIISEPQVSRFKLVSQV